MKATHSWFPIVAASLLSSLAGCAGSTVGSGVGDRVLIQPPFNAGRMPPADAIIVYTPIAWQAGAVNPANFDPSAESGPVKALIADMNDYVTGLLGHGPLTTGEGEPLSRPDVRFSCEVGMVDECDEDGPVRNGRREMRLAVTRASSEWQQWIAGMLNREGATHALLITVEIGEYWPRQKDLLGRKEIELGSTYTVSLPWLTGLDRPVSVIQVTGALVDTTGRAVRIGAEGMLARRTNLLVGSIDGQVLITDEDVIALRSEEREIAGGGRMLVWQAALRDLVSGLAGGI